MAMPKLFVYIANLGSYSYPCDLIDQYYFSS